MPCLLLPDNRHAGEHTEHTVQCRPDSEWGLPVQTMYQDTEWVSSRDGIILCEGQTSQLMEPTMYNWAGMEDYSGGLQGVGMGADRACVLPQSCQPFWALLERSQSLAHSQIRAMRHVLTPKITRGRCFPVTPWRMKCHTLTPCSLILTLCNGSVSGLTPAIPTGLSFWPQNLPVNIFPRG